MLLSGNKKTAALSQRPVTSKPGKLSQSLNAGLKANKFTSNLKSKVNGKNNIKFDNSYQNSINNTSMNQSQRAGFKSFQGKKLNNTLGKSLLNLTANKRKESSSNTGTIEDQKTSLKEMIESATADQRALSLIDDTIELIAHNQVKDSKGSEKYELIDKEEFDKMKKDNAKFKEEKKVLHEEYQRLKEQFEKITYELNTMNYVYYNVEKAKTDSITKIYSMESELKKLVLYNNKLQNEIKKEINEKNNVFRALNEFKRKYETSIPEEIKEIYQKITDDTYSPTLNVDNTEKVDLLEDKVAQMTKELEEKNEKIENLKQRIAEMNKEVK